MKARLQNLKSQVNDAQNTIERMTRLVAHLDHMMALARKVTGRDSVEACALASLAVPYMSGKRWHAQRELEETQFALGCLLQLQIDGKCYLSTFSRDCDNMQSSSVRQHNSLASALAARESYLAGAEGPCAVRPISREEFDARKGHDDTRDLALEAYENGHPHVIYT